MIRHPSEGVASASSAAVDAAVFGVHTFREELARHRFRVLCCAFAPPASVLKADTKELFAGFVFERRKFLAAVEEEVERDWERARKWCDVGGVWCAPPTRGLTAQPTVCVQF